MAPTDQASAYCLHEDDYEDVARSNLDARTKIHDDGPLSSCLLLPFRQKRARLDRLGVCAVCKTCGVPTLSSLKLLEVKHEFPAQDMWRGRKEVSCVCAPKEPHTTPRTTVQNRLFVPTMRATHFKGTSSPLQYIEWESEC